ncbi:hypothetical protein [Sphingobium sp. B2]|nr:hypothetical protein [Sphingobium sp. B2]
MKTITNDNARYALGEKMRELGYLNASDFLSANPPEDHVREVERLVMP